MPERIKQLYTALFTLRKVLLIAVIIFSFGAKAFADVENLLVTLNINEAYFYDYEVVVNDDGSFSLPVKATAEILNIKYEQNHFTKEITILNKVIPPKLLVNQGILEKTKNEIFLSIDDINSLFNENFRVDLADYSVSLVTKRQFEKPLQATVIENEFYPEDKKDINLVIPGKQPGFSVDSIKLDESLQSDYTSENNLIATTDENIINNNMQAVLTGRVFNGKYKIRSNLRSYDSKPFSFSGISANYEKEWNKYRLELGSLSNLKISNINAAEQVLGISLGNERKLEENKPDFSSLVNNDRNINLFENDKFIKTTTVKALKDEVIKENSLITEEDSNKYTIIAGVTGYQDNFFSNYELENDSIAKKLVSGIKYSGKITDKLSFETLGIGDYIFSTPNSCDYSSFLTTNVPLLALSINKNFRCQHGASGIVSLKHNTFEDFSITADVGGSFSDSKSTTNLQKIDNAGYMSVIKLELDKPDWVLAASVFDYSPDFYLAGSSGLSGSSAYMNDKRGGKLSGKYNHRFISSRGEISKYYSNRDGYLQGGDFDFLDYNFRVKIPVTKKGYTSFYRRAREGNNNAGEISSELNRLDFHQRLTSRLNFSLSAVSNKFDSEYTSSTQSQNNYSSKYATFTARSDYRIPKNIGTVSLMHEIAKTESGDFERDNNTMRVGYTFPRFFNIGSTVFVGYKYKGLENGVDLSVDIDYIFNSGRTLGLTYQYNRQSGIFLDDLYIPRTNRHSFAVNLSDVYSFVEGSLRPDGLHKENNGHIKLVTFLDVNKDGIMNGDEPQIPDIPFRIAGSKKDIFTGKKGDYISKSMPEGIYDVKVNYNELPTLLSVSPASHSEYNVKVDKQNLTKVYVGLISSVGNISGKLVITDEFGRHLNLRNVVVTVTGENGKEVDYTTVSEGETYYIAGLSPGTYTISVDKNFLKAYNLVAKNGINSTVTIPPVFDDYVDVENFDIEYVQNFEAL